jgi:4-aminobutyrate aminotransferase-like enzyme
MRGELQRMVDAYPSVLAAVRGLGFMLGVELRPRQEIPALAGSDKPAATQVVNRLHAEGVLTIPSGAQVFRLLPALNLSRPQAEEGLEIIERVIRGIAGA